MPFVLSVIQVEWDEGISELPEQQVMSRRARIRWSLVLPRYRAEKSAAETTQHGRRIDPGWQASVRRSFNAARASRFGRPVVSGAGPFYLPGGNYSAIVLKKVQTNSEQKANANPIVDAVG